MSGENWGPCPTCKTPLSRANASRLRSGAVVHVGCKGESRLVAALREEVALAQAAKDRLSALANGLPDPGMPGEGEAKPRAGRRSRGGPPGGVASSGPVTVKVEDPAFGAPLVQASGPTDYEALGRERYWDTPEAERASMLKGVLEQLKPGTPEPDRRFADGWLDEHNRAKRMLTDRVPPEVDRSAMTAEQVAAMTGGEVVRLPSGREAVRVDLKDPAPTRRRNRVSLRGRSGRETEDADAGEAGAQAGARPGTEAGGAGPPGVEREEEPGAPAGDRPDGGPPPAEARRGRGASVDGGRFTDRSVNLPSPELGPDGTEVVALPPLAKTAPEPSPPVAPPPPVHLLVPGFPKHACCAERDPGELVHLFDGFPELRPGRSGCVETRCGRALLRDFSMLEAVPFVSGHKSCCPACSSLLAPGATSLRTYAAFVPPPSIGPGKIES